MTERVFAERGPWLFSRELDLLAFGGSALVSWLLVVLGAALGLLHEDTPPWGFLAWVVAVDVAHVWSTGFRVYFDRAERAQRPLLYFGLPALAYLTGVALHAVDSRAFWRALAYVALFHFMRQQAGFLALYQRRSPASGPLDRLLERTTLYVSMGYPVLAWHAQLPRNFAWLMQGDFIADGALQALLRALLPAARLSCGLLLVAFVLRQLALARAGKWVPGKSVLVLATASCWIGGIVVFDSDYVFTVTNVLIHGVPYFLLTYRYARASGGASWARRTCARGFIPFALVCVVLASAEETLWDRLVWHEHPQLFGMSRELSAELLVFVVPLLAVPQLTHYLLDGFVWRVRSENPVLRRELERA
jgi:hypothetical protein